MRRLRAWLVTTPRGPRVTVRLHYERRPKARRGRASEGKPRKQGSRMMPVHKRKTVRGTERRGGAPRGGRPASWDVRARARALRAYVIGPLQRVPLHPSACRRSAPSTLLRGDLANLGGQMPRENDDARVVCRVGHKGVDARLRRAMGASSRRAHHDVATTSKEVVGTLRFAHPTATTCYPGPFATIRRPP